MNENIKGHILGLEPVSIIRNSLRITVDPRMELLSVVQFLSNYDSRYSLLTKLDFPYRQQIANRFSEFRKHAAVEMFNELSLREFKEEAPPFSFSSPPEVMLYIKDDFSLRSKIFEKDFLIKRAGGDKCLLAFIQNLNSFASESGFYEFYTGNMPFYKEIVNNTVERIGSKDYISLLENFYGIKQKGYTLILVPMFHCGGFGPSVEDDDGTNNIFSIIGPTEVQSGLPDFGSRSWFDNLQQHEFSHSFVNPLTEKYCDLADKYTELYNSIETDMIKQAYGNWRDVLNEHIIRAITTRFAYLESREAGDSTLALEKSRGFTYVDALLDKLNEYEDNRSMYPAFEAFYPELLKALDTFLLKG